MTDDANSVISQDNNNNIIIYLFIYWLIFNQVFLYTVKF